MNQKKQMKILINFMMFKKIRIIKIELKDDSIKIIFPILK